MHKCLLCAMLFCCVAMPAHAQWAVFDDEVKKQLLLVNKIQKFEDFSSDKPYDHYESQSSDRGDIRMGSGDSQAILKGLDIRFEKSEQLSELTQQEIAKYVGSEADCGQEKVSPKHFEACMGLRNLRLQTIVQSQSLLKNIAKRREQIVKLIRKSRDLPADDDKSSLGQLQRAMFEIQRRPSEARRATEMHRAAIRSHAYFPVLA